MILKKVPKFLSLLFIGLILSCNKQEKVKSIENDSARVDAKILPFSDQSLASESFFAFKSDLESAIDTGNQDAILSKISDLLEINPGTELGKAGIIEIWDLDGSPEKLLPLKSFLKSLLSRGGCFDNSPEDSGYTIPYYNCIFSLTKEKCGESGCAVVVQDGADFFKVPNLSDKIMGTLSGNQIIFNYVDTLCNETFTKCDWRKMTLENGEIGYVPREKLQTEFDGKLWVVKELTGWKIRVIKGPDVPSDDT